MKVNESVVVLKNSSMNTPAKQSLSKTIKSDLTAETPEKLEANKSMDNDYSLTPLKEPSNLFAKEENKPKSNNSPSKSPSPMKRVKKSPTIDGIKKITLHFHKDKNKKEMKKQEEDYGNNAISTTKYFEVKITHF